MRFVVVGDLKTGRAEGFIYRGRGPLPPLVDVPDPEEPKDTAPPDPEKEKQPE